ncbi:MAG: hypothetical protein DWB42_09670 [Chloroflexi bacterium]|nr:hypothetical protein [Chloroflexota bacterium]MDL1883588.1 hypothetical protein [Anaerolineae bacterium CFX8]
MNQGTKRLTVILGVVMIIAMGSSVIIPVLNPTRNQSLQATEAVPTDVPIPTFPPPPDDLSAITFDQDIVHPSGLFSIAQPPGWLPLASVTSSSGASTTPELNLNNSERSSIIQAVAQPSGGLDTLEQLDAYYTSDILRQSWSAYGSWRELTRRQENDKLIIDFELTNRLGQTFVARQESWVKDGWLYRLRVITPENAPDMLKYLMDNLEPTFQLNPALAGVPLDWKGFFDAGTNMAVRFPADWTLTDNAVGRTASFSGGGAVLRLDSLSGQAAADEAAARAWVETSRPGVEVLSVQPVTRGDNQGFSVAYRFADADGNPQSGLAVLLNSASSLYVANLRFAGQDVDLNTEAGRAAQPNLAQVMDTFTVLSNVNVPLPTPTPSPTPLASPTPIPTAEPTAENTPEATEGS